MTTPSYQRRFMAQADANPHALDAYARQVLGHDMATAHRLLQIHRSLVDGRKIDPTQHDHLRRAFPQVPVRQLAGIVAALNDLDPGIRAQGYLGLLAGDMAVVSGDLANAGPAYKQLTEFTKAYHTEAAAEQIAEKREANTDREIAARKIERRPEDPMSTRALIAAQIDGKQGKLAREVTDAMERGDPRAEGVVRESLAQTVERASERLRPDAEDVSTRDTVAAAFDFHEAESIAVDQGFAQEPT
jgi:hypothetical protein